MSGKTTRRNWTASLSAVTLAAAAAVVFGYFADVGAENKGRFYLRSSAGPVLFDHATHAGAGDSCASCHHTLYGADQVSACADCHDADITVDLFDHAQMKEAHHGDCSTCHAQVGQDQQASSCRDCHGTAQPAPEQTAGCSQCHDDSYTPGLISHDEALSIEAHSCRGCHTPRPLAEAYHDHCTQCHQEQSPVRFSNPDGAVLCGACHLR